MQTQTVIRPSSLHSPFQVYLSEDLISNEADVRVWQESLKLTQSL